MKDIRIETVRDMRAFLDQYPETTPIRISDCFILANDTSDMYGTIVYLRSDVLGPKPPAEETARRRRRS